MTFSVFKNVDEMNVGDRYARMFSGCGRKYPKAGSPAGVPMHVLEMCMITGTRILAGRISSAAHRRFSNFTSRYQAAYFNLRPPLARTRIPIRPITPIRNEDGSGTELKPNIGVSVRVKAEPAGEMSPR